MKIKMTVTKKQLKLYARCWKLVRHKDFIQCKDKDDDSFSVGLQKEGMTVNEAILGRGITLEKAVLEAVKALTPGKELKSTYQKSATSSTAVASTMSTEREQSAEN